MNISKFFESFSIPGFSNLFKSDNIFIKIIWILCYLALLTASGIFLADTIIGYLDFEVVTNINIIREQKSEFPTVSFCFTSFEKQAEQNPLDLKDILIVCSFEKKACNWTDFEFYTIKYPSFNSDLNLTCYRFNSGRNYYNETTSIKSISRYGPETGLVVLFKIKDFYYDIYDDFKVQFKTAIFIQNQSSLFRRDHAYNLDTGYYTPSGLSHITIEREFIQKLPDPHSECKSNSDYFIFPPNKTYQQKDCLDLCFENIILQKCNCTNSNEQSIKDCLNNNNNDGIKSKCIGEQLRTFIMNKDKDLFQFCLEKCPIECDLIKYKTTANYYGTVTEEYYNFLVNETNLINPSLTFEQIKTDGVYISISYQSLDYTLINQIPKMLTFDLISNLGGTLGLFLGISFLTLVELLDILIRIISSCFIKKQSF